MCSQPVLPGNLLLSESEKHTDIPQYLHPHVSPFREPPLPPAFCILPTYPGNFPLNGAEILLSRMGDNIPVVVISIFISTFVAEEFYTGRIRLILPHSESKIRFYLSKLVVCSIAMVFANIIELGLYSLIATIGWGFDPNNVFNLPGFIMFIILQIIV